MKAYRWKDMRAAALERGQITEEGIGELARMLKAGAAQGHTAK